MFISEQEGGQSVYIVNADGSNLVQLTSNTAQISSPQWSPDGTKILFVSAEKSGVSVGEIYTASADGSGLTRVTTDKITGTRPMWSPDGSKIVFISLDDSVDYYATCSPSFDVGTCESDVYVVNADGSGLTNMSSDKAMDIKPSWSPDSSQIAFVSSRDGDEEVFIVNSDGSELAQLTDMSDWHDKMSIDLWSPDGKWLFLTYQATGAWVRHAIMDSHGSGPVDLPAIEHNGWPPAYAPDKARIAFLSSDWGVSIMNADGSNPVSLTGSHKAIGDVVWSADGTQIFYECNYGSGSGKTVCMVMADGSNSTTNLIPAGLGGYSFPGLLVLPNGMLMVWDRARGGKRCIVDTNGACIERQEYVMSFSPDREWVTFASNGDIYVMQGECMSMPTGKCESGMTNLTNSAALDGLPVWQP